MTRKLFIAALISLLAPIGAYIASLFTDGFGPCGSMAGFYCFWAFLLFGAISGLLFVLVFASMIADRLRT